MKRRPPPEEYRAVDCPRYPECLRLAALFDHQRMRCAFCSMRGDVSARIGVDNLSAMDVIGSRELLMQIFFGKEPSFEKNDETL